MQVKAPMNQFSYVIDSRHGEEPRVGLLSLILWRTIGKCGPYGVWGGVSWCSRPWVICWAFPANHFPIRFNEKVTRDSRSCNFIGWCFSQAGGFSLRSVLAKVWQLFLKTNTSCSPAVDFPPTKGLVLASPLLFLKDYWRSLYTWFFSRWFHIWTEWPLASHYSLGPG